MEARVIYIWSVAVTVVLMSVVTSTNGQCMCSCSSVEPTTGNCPDKPPHQGKANASGTSPGYCPDQTELKGLLESVQHTVAGLRSELYQIRSSIADLQESIPDAISTQLNISWTVSPGVENPNTTFPGDIIWEGVHRTHPRDCREILEAGDSRGDGVYRIYSQADDKFTNVRCSMYCDGGGWMELMRRSDGSVNFDRPWTDYVNGFGDYKREFWMGLDFMNKITSQYRDVTVRLDFITFQDDHKYAQYTGFAVGDSTTNYQMRTVTYTGSAGNMFTYGSGKSFSTYDADHDGYSSTNCAKHNGGGWWYYPNSVCGNVYPTGVINQTYIDAKRGGIAYGVNTGNSGYYHYKEVVMKVRPAFGLP